jgi:hypothetical protein
MGIQGDGRLHGRILSPTAPLYLPPWVQKANGLAGMLAFSPFANNIRLDTRARHKYGVWRRATMGSGWAFDLRLGA